VINSWFEHIGRYIPEFLSRNDVKQLFRKTIKYFEEPSKTFKKLHELETLAFLLHCLTHVPERKRQILEILKERYGIDLKSIEL